jgi:hypothetical protein
MSGETNITGIATALANIMAEAGAIGKDSRNTQQNFNFRGIDAVMNHLHPIFAKHGVVILPEVLTDKTEERETRGGGHLIYRMLRVQYGFMARDGSRVYTTVQGEGMDSGDKASNKAMAVALKYALTQMLLLPYDEVDPDATTPDPSRPKQTAPTTPPTTRPAATAAPAQQAQQAASAPKEGPLSNLSIITLPAVRQKEGTSAKGPWTRTYGKADEDGEFYSTFDKKVAAQMIRLEGTPMTVKAIKGEKGNTIAAIIEADATEPAEQSYTPERDGGGDDLPF